MLNFIRSKLRQRPTNDDAPSGENSRKFARHAGTRCVTEVNGVNHPTIDWSLGGVLIHGDTRLFGLGDPCAVTLKFRLRDDVVAVPHAAHVVRKTRDRIALEFEPLSAAIRKQFQSVIDDESALEFIESQA
ncbi:MAG: PilZ domain-containing protein [Bdellovibrionales bacterium]